MKGVNLVRKALEEDMVKQSRKYGCVDPCAATSRFTVDLPRSPQHQKYSRRDRALLHDASALKSPVSTMSAGSGGLEASGASISPISFEQPDGAKQNAVRLMSADGEEEDALGELSAGGDVSRTGSYNGRFFGFKFNKRTLQKWFKDIDRDGSGSITQRELIVALRARPETLKIFQRIQGFDVKDEKEDVFERNSDELREREKAKIYRIKEILSDIDTDGNGTMEWDEFVDFFRRAGLLLEYKTQSALNRTSLCVQAENTKELRKQEEERQGSKELTGRRTAISRLGDEIGDIFAGVEELPVF